MAKLLSRISHLDELHPLKITNSLDYIEGHPQGIIYKPQNSPSLK